MQAALSYRTNRDLFSNYYLDEYLPETEEWDKVSEDKLLETYDTIMGLWEREKSTAPKRNESHLEENFIRPIFRKLEIPFEVEKSTTRTQRRPDYGFFETEEVARESFERREEGGDFYENAVAVADAKRWDRPLDTRGSGKYGDFENPSYQIHVYLQQTPARWAVLTNGKKWRLYYGPTSHRLDSYYEIDLPTILESGDLEDFKDFYLFFRYEAFLEDASGDCFLDDVYDGSNVFAQELEKDLQDNIYEAIRILSEGFLQYPENDLDEDDLSLIHDSSLIYLYRLIFVLYAEAEGRELLDPSNEIYEQSYSLNTLKQEVAAEFDSDNPTYCGGQSNLWDRLDELFKLIDQGSKSCGIPEDDLYIPAYNGDLFRTDSDADSSPESRFLAEHRAGDIHLARVIELLSRNKNSNDGRKVFVDYSSLDVRHLGSIYEGLLEYKLNVADEPLALDDGEYVIANEGDDVVVEESGVYLTMDSGERKVTGSYYTPEYIVEYIVENTLEPLVDDIREDLVGYDTASEGRFAEEFADRVFDLKVLDPAMGSGHFLTRAVDYLAREIIDAQERQAAQQGVKTIDEDHDINWARRQVAQRCIYGVDLNPLAVELAKMSLWLRTFVAEQPLAFLDHHLKVGNSLVGSDIEEIKELESESGGDGENATLTDFDIARKGTIEQLVRIYQDSISTENEELVDINNIEYKYNKFYHSKLRQRLEAMANVHTAEDFDSINIPNEAHQRMAASLEDDDEWDKITETQWFKQAQRWAKDDRYFHWKLEFLDIFYGSSDDKKSDPRFNVVIGNPPYIRSRNLPATHKKYYKSQYQSAEGAYDIYIPFLEQAANLGERISFIIPNKWTTTNYGKVLRTLLLDDYKLHELVDISNTDVFTNADIYPLIISYSAGSESGISDPTIKHIEDTSDIDSTPGITVSSDIIKQLGGHVIPVNLTPEFAPIIEKTLSQGSRLGDHIEMTEAIHTGNVRDKLIVDEDVDSDCEPLADGTSITRYQVKRNGKYIRYNKNLINTEDGEYGNLRNNELFNRKEKLYIRDISYRPVAAYDDSQLFALNTLYSVTRQEESDYSLKYLLAVFNSEFINQYFRQVYGGTHVSGDYLRFKPMFSYNIQIPEPNSEVIAAHEEDIRAFDSTIDTSSTTIAMEQLTDIISDYKDTKDNLNMVLPDVLGNYSEGKSISEISGYQPSKGVVDSELSKTVNSLENLRVGSVDVSGKGSKITILASARYKPDDQDKLETDRWGYTETDLMAAMEFVGLDKKEQVLIREFVPYAVEEAGGFAGFRETATKTKSLIDRLEGITLPAIDDISNELDQYIDKIKKEKKLDEKIQTADHLIDEIVYDLYGLTEDEKQTIESKR